MEVFRNAVAYLFSLIGHPMVVVMYMLFLYIKVNPYLFPYASGRDLTTMILIIFFTSVLIPLIGILLMLGVGFIDSLEMRDSKERIGPLIITGISYLWLYLNVRTHNAIPIPYANFILGSLISLSLAFFINNFSKISLHGVGMGGLVMGTIYLISEYGKGVVNLELFQNNLIVNNLVILVAIVIFSGLVLTSRLLLGAHTNQEVAGGFMIGALGQLVVMMFF